MNLRSQNGHSKITTKVISGKEPKDVFQILILTPTRPQNYTGFGHRLVKHHTRYVTESLDYGLNC